MKAARPAAVPVGCFKRRIRTARKTDAESAARLIAARQVGGRSRRDWRRPPGPDRGAERDGERVRPGRLTVPAWVPRCFLRRRCLAGVIVGRLQRADSSGELAFGLTLAGSPGRVAWRQNRAAARRAE